MIVTSSEFLLMAELSWNRFFIGFIYNNVIYHFQLHVPFSMSVLEFQVKMNSLWKLDDCSDYSWTRI